MDLSKGVELHFGLNGVVNCEEALRCYDKASTAISLSTTSIANYCIWLLFSDGKLDSIGKEKAQRHIKMAADLGHEESRKIWKELASSSSK